MVVNFLHESVIYEKFITATLSRYKRKCEEKAMQ